MTLSSSVSSPRLVNTSIGWTAAPIFGIAPVEYKWWIQRQGGAWTVLREWAASPSYEWIPAVSGSYNVRVWARDAGVTADTAGATDTRAFTIAPLLELTASPPPPQVQGTSVTVTAHASGGVPPYSYKWLFTAYGTDWTVLYDWAPNITTMTRTLTVASANTKFLVRVRSADNTSDLGEASVELSYPITAIPEPTCGFTLSPSNVTVSAANGYVSFAISAPAGCRWQAQRDSNFLHLITPDSATGNGTVTYSIENNTGDDARVAALTIANSTAVVTQQGTVPEVPPPAVPNTPSPGHGVTGVTVLSPSLTWSAAGATDFEVRFGTISPPPVVVSSGATTAYRPGTLQRDTIYYWQVVARSAGGTTISPIWSFRTTAVAPPAAAASPSPVDDAIGITAPTLTWNAPGAATYDVHFGTTQSPPRLAADLLAASYITGELSASTTYYWRIVARNVGGETQGPLWSFTTAPAVPTSPVPGGGAAGVATTPLLTWTSNDATTFDVYFGETNPPVIAAAGVADARFWPGLLAPFTTYYWQVVVHSAAGTTAGPIWAFTTGAQLAVVYDTYTPTGTGELLISHIPDAVPAGTVWNMLEGSSPAVDGAASSPGGDRWAIAAIASGHADAVVAVDVTSTSPTPVAGLVLRAADAGNLLALRFVGDEVSGRIQLDRRVNGEFTDITSVTVAPLDATSHRLEARLVGGSITAVWDGTPIFEITVNDNQWSGQHGVLWDRSADTSVRYDNFAVTTDTYAPVAPGTFCQGGLSPAYLQAEPGNENISVRVAMPAGCTWEVRMLSGAGFASFTGSTIRSGTSDVQFRLSNNLDSFPRIAYASVAGRVLPIVQAGQVIGDCQYQVTVNGEDRDDVDFPSGGGTATVTIAPYYPSCTWAIASSDQWITVPNGSVRSGEGTFTVSAPRYDGTTTRNGRIWASTAEIPVEQQSEGCWITVSPNSFEVDVDGGSFFVTVTTPPGCGWEAVSLVDWLQVTENPSGSGEMQIRIHADNNPPGHPSHYGIVEIRHSPFTPARIQFFQNGEGFDPSRDVVTYYHTDAIGSVRLLTNAAGQSIARYDYLPFGEDAPGSSDVSETRRFAGTQRDPATENDYFGARYYASRTGRLTTVDPVMNIEAALTDPQRWDRYTYSLNNPLRYIDSDGAEVTTPAVFFTTAFQQQTADTLRAAGKVVVNIGRAINSPGHMTPEAETRYFEQPDSAAEASRMQFFDLMLTAAPALLGLRGHAGALRSVGTIDDVFSAPAALRGGITPEQLMQRLGALPKTWRVEALGKGSQEGAGWMLREYTPQGNPTGRQIRWHPGGGHHGQEPYWRVINYNQKSDIIR